MLSLPFIGVGHRERTAVFLSIMPKKRPTTMATNLFQTGNSYFGTSLPNEGGELIPLQDYNGKKAVSARLLHSFLESKQQFADWIKNRIEQCDLIENQDFEVFQNFMKNPNGGRPLTEYALTIDSAKEISMMEGNEKGKQARRYFIACEHKLKELSSPSYMISDPIKRAEKWIEEEKVRQQLALENEMNRPKVVYFDNLVSRNLLTNLRDTARQIHVPQNKFISLLIDNKYLYRDAKEKLKPYSQYVPMYFELKDFEKNGHAGTQLLVTPKGKETFRLMWGGVGYEN